MLCGIAEGKPIPVDPAQLMKDRPSVSRVSLRFIAFSIRALAAAVAVGCAGAGEPPIREAAALQSVSAEPGSDEARRLQWIPLPVLLTCPPRGAELDAQHREILRDLVTPIRQRPGHVERLRIEGHIERCALAGDDPRGLSGARALSVRSELLRLETELPELETRASGDAYPRGDHFDCDERGRAARRRACELSLCVERRVVLSILACPDPVRLAS